MTLENFNGERLEIYRSGKITLELKGANAATDVRFLGAGVSTEGNHVTIIGSGSLTVSNMIISIPVVQTSATITTTDEAGKYYGLLINAGDNTSFRMTGGTLNATGLNYGIQVDSPQGQILLENGTVTAQGGSAAIWCVYLAPPKRSTDLLSVGGREIVGGETARNTQVMSIKTASTSHEYPGPITDIKTKHFTSISAKELTLEEDFFASDHAKNSGAAKYVYISGVSSSTTSVQSETPVVQSAVASPTNDNLTADGAVHNPTVYKIDGSNYFRIRDLAAILNGTGKQFSVGYDSTLNSVTATTGEGYEKQPGDLAGAPAGGAKDAQPSNDVIYINGKKADAQVYKIDGSNYFKLRDLGKALGFYVGWSAEQGMYIETDKPYAE